MSAQATAKARWEKLNGGRASVLARARACSEITIPSLMPPEGSTEDSVLSTPYQSLGARGVNNLASKLLLTLLPPNQSFFRFSVDDTVAAALGQSRTDVEEVFRVMEKTGMRRIETGNLRKTLHAALKHLVAVGNGLLYMPSASESRFFRLNQYCVVRSPSGRVTEIVIKECVTPSTLSEEVAKAHDVDRSKDDPVDLFTWVKLKGGRHEWFQELNEKQVAGSDGHRQEADSPFIVLRWTAVENEHYGRGLVEEYLGDLRSLEGLNKAVIQFAAVAAKIVLLLHPNSSTDEDALRSAESGDIVTGSMADLEVLQLDKYADFQVAKALADDLSLRLSHAFLLQSGTVRDAERVTAEEIRAMAQELEDVLGGVYTVQSQELQLPLVRRLMVEMRDAGEFPELPKLRGKDLVSPVIVTGFDALGRGHELNAYRAYFADIAATMGDLSMFRPQWVAQKLATGHNIDISEGLKSAEELAQEQQAQVGMSMLDKAAGPIAGAAAKAISQ